jgi:hypothetical protein
MVRGGRIVPIAFDGAIEYEVVAFVDAASVPEEEGRRRRAERRSSPPP